MGAMSAGAWRALLVLALTSTIAPPAHAVIQVQDDTGEVVRVSEPVRRIVSLAPHITELLFAAGAGRYVVGAAEYSDFPEIAVRIPRIGGAGGVDLEGIVTLRPDLVVAWQSGNSPWSVTRLEELGVTVFRSEPRRIEDIAANIERLGTLAGTLDVAGRASAAFRRRYSELRSRYSQQKGVTVFYQIWHRPLMTVNGRHLISDVIRLCGGVNVFSSLPTLTPTINVEAVLHARPQAIVAAGTDNSDVLDTWRQWPYVDAAKKGNLFLIPYNLIARQTPRVLDGAERLCAALERVRKSQN